MTVLYTILAILIVAVIWLLLSKIKVYYEYHKYPEEKFSSTLKLKLGFIDLTWLIKEKSLEEKLKFWLKVLKILKEVYPKNRTFVQKSLIINDIDFHIKFGLSDPDKTAPAAAGIWAFLHSILSLASSLGTLKDHFFEVAPVYTEPGLIVKGHFKISIRLINALSILWKMYLIYRKLPKESK